MRAATRSFRPGASNIRFSNLTRIKLVIVILAILTFGYGVRNEVAEARWVAVGLLAVAFLLRFASRSEQQ